MNLALLSVIVLTWGFSWYAITFQLGPVAPEVSLVWRFALAGAGLGLWLIATRRWRPVPLAAHPWLVLVGLGLFSLNFFSFYIAIGYMPSGVASVLFSTASLFGALNQWWLLRRRPDTRVLVGAVLGALGIGALFSDSLLALSGSDGAVGLGLAMIGTYIFSLGSLAAAKASARADLPNAMARAMLYGAAACTVIAMLRGAQFAMAWTPAYVGSLVYLALFASVAAFLAYLTLVNRVGPARAGYTTVLFPLVALTVSSVAEGFAWTPLAGAGVLLVLGGVVLVFTPGRRGG